MAEAALILGLIGSIITCIDGAKQVFDAVRDTQGQPDAFRQVYARLDLVRKIIIQAQVQVRRAEAFDNSAALKNLLKSCKKKAEDLEELFHEVIRKDNSKWFDRYKSALMSLGKSKRVELLMGGILKDIQVLACEKIMGAATEAQVKELQEAISEICAMPPSIVDEVGDQYHQSNSGEGHAYGIFGGSGSISVQNTKGNSVYHQYAAGSHVGSKE